MSDNPDACIRCGERIPTEIDLLDGAREPEYCPFCGFDLSRTEYDVDVISEYITPDAPETDLEELADLIKETSAARGADLYAVEICGKSAAEWAEMTNRDRSTVSRNIRRAKSD